jgi:PEP-CTERM motif
MKYRQSWNGSEVVMRNSSVAFVAAVTLALLLAVATPSAIASTIDVQSLLGSPVTGTSSVTGTTTINPLGALGNTVVGPGPEFGFCVGPNANNCVSSGLSGSVDISDAQIAFTFFGSTNAATGSFSVLLSNFSQTILNVAYVSGALQNGSFGLTSFNSSSILFTGTPSGNYSAIGGDTILFNVTSVPEPASLTLLGLGLAGIAARSRRALRKRHS